MRSKTISKLYDFLLVNLLYYTVQMREGEWPDMSYVIVNSLFLKL